MHAAGRPVNNVVSEEEQGNQEIILDDRLLFPCISFGQDCEDLPCAPAVNLVVSKHESTPKDCELMRCGCALGDEGIKKLPEIIPSVLSVLHYHPAKPELCKGDATC